MEELQAEVSLPRLPATAAVTVALFQSCLTEFRIKTELD